MINIGECKIYKGKRIYRASKSFWKIGGTWKTFKSYEEAKTFIDYDQIDEFHEVIIIR